MYTTGDFADPADFDPGPGTVNLTGEGIFVLKLVVSEPVLTTWVDFGFVGSEYGSVGNPFDTLAEGLAHTLPLGTVKIKGNTGDSDSNETMTIDQVVTIEAVNGAVRIGDLGVPPDIPVIGILGLNPVSVPLDSVYIDAGAIALDIPDGDITADIVTFNPVNTSIASQYFVTYDVTDSDGNAAITTVRIVNVVGRKSSFVSRD